MGASHEFKHRNRGRIDRDIGAPAMAQILTAHTPGTNEGHALVTEGNVGNFILNPCRKASPLHPTCVLLRRPREDSCGCGVPVNGHDASTLDGWRLPA